VRILITGATGFAGRHLSSCCTALGHEVHALVRPGREGAVVRGVRAHVADLGDAAQVGALVARVAPEGVVTVTTVADDATAAVTIPSAGDSVRLDDGIITTETERAVFEYVIRRLPFLIDRDEALYQKLTNLYPRDYKTRFTVCYKQDRNGRLFNFQELSQEPRYRFEFPDTGAVVQTSTLGDIDQELLTAYMKRVAELG